MLARDCLSHCLAWRVRADVVEAWFCPVVRGHVCRIESTQKDGLLSGDCLDDFFLRFVKNFSKIWHKYFVTTSFEEFIITQFHANVGESGLLLPRRAVLGACVGLASTLSFGLAEASELVLDDPAPARGGMWTQPRTLWLKRHGVPASRSQLQVTYWADGAIQPQGYREACIFLRDLGFEKAILRGDSRVLSAVRKGLLPDQIPTAAPISMRVLDSLYAIGQWLSYFGMGRPVIVTSAFRHPFYNNHMVEGAARDGFHTKARAVDIRIDGVSPDRVAQFGRWLGVGGIGLYQSRGFLHIDDGAQRTWRGR